MLWDYRSEKWFTILTSLLRRVINCAQLTASTQEFILFSIEALSDSINLPQEYKNLTYQNLQKVFQNSIPEINSETGTILATDIQQLWANSPSKIVTIEMNNSSLCMQTKAKFQASSYQINDKISVDIFCRSCSSLQIQFSQISILINSPNYSNEIFVPGENFVFESNETKHLVAEFKPELMDVGKEIQITAVLLYMGTDPTRRAVLKFSGLGNEVYGKDHTFPEFMCLSYKRNSVYYEAMPRISTLIHQRVASLNLVVENTPPVLIGEWYPMIIKFKNEENAPVNDVKVNIGSKCEFTQDKCKYKIELNRSTARKPPKFFAVSDPTNI